MKLAQIPVAVRYGATLASLGIVIFIDKKIIALSPTTIAMTFLVVVLLASAYWGARHAVVLAIAAAAAFNFFFLPPYGTFAIADPRNWLELAAFLFTALFASNLAERARREARERERALEELAKSEAAQETDRLRSALLDSLTHEFRTPLTGSKASVTTLLSGHVLERGESQELLTVIDEETDRLNRMVGEAADMAQLDARKFTLDLHPTDMAEIVESALLDTRITQQHRPIENLCDTTMPPVLADFTRIREALVHLLENAGKYSRAGTAIRVWHELRDNYVVTLIGDKGEGILPEEQALIFDKFYRGRNHRYSARGTGMGLAIVKAIVEAHGGSITVKSDAGVGSVFSISLPVARASK